ncbi:MAG: molybdopterin oxidoreductase, partial [Verrucomicrobiae bacterium]|nr:molybdopterin oxidoreductase [Verrucomicrobiae bacterium]
APVIDAGYAAVRDTFATIAGGMDEDKWNFSLRDGFLKGSAGAAAGAPNLGAVAAIVGQAQAPAALDGTTFEVVLATDSSMLDGRYASNAWLQEAPDPITKLTWDNAALVSQKTAEELAVTSGDVIKVTVGDASVELPVLVSPGQADFVIQVALGYYGDLRDGNGEPVNVGSIATGVGFSVWALRSTAAPFIFPGAVVEKANRHHDLALTSEHYSMEGRAIVREGTVEMYQKDATFAGHQGMD